MRTILAASAALLTLVSAARAAPGSDTAAMANRIADQGFNHGEVAQTIGYLSDRIGGRMTNSPAMREAERWTQDKFRGWGLKNVHKEGFEFGRGWWIESSHARMVAPRPVDMKAIPLAWTPATNGPLVAPVVVAPIRLERDLAQYHGKLAGKIVLVTWPRPPKDETDAPFQRYTEADIGKLNAYKQASFDPDEQARRIERGGFGRKVDAFLKAEGAVAYVKMSRSEGRLVHGEGSGWQVGKTFSLPAIELAAEDYRKLARLAKTGEVKLEIDNKVHFVDDDTKAYNVLAEIPGSDPKAGYVMAGAHLDSWVAGDGSADNGAGSAVVMEAARILASLDAKPKRTIRFVLWAGEEQGLLGSFAYIDQHLAKRPLSTDPAALELGPYYATDTYPVTPLPEFGQMAGYFNLDNGSGKIRGIYTEGNFAVVPQLKEWLAPFASLGASTVVASPTTGTDHQIMAKLGLPAYQFIQDPLDYDSRVHHTDLDVYDHLRIEDMRQASVVMASVLWSAANSETPLPRNTLPTQPVRTDPYSYPDPAQN